MSAWLNKHRAQIAKNPNVEKVTEKHITFTSEFKNKLIEDNKNGIAPLESFQKAGFDLSIFPKHYLKDAVMKLKLIHQKYGDLAFSESRRGRRATGRKPKHPKKLDEKQLLNRVAYLEAEVDFLKKLRALAKQGK